MRYRLPTQSDFDSYDEYEDALSLYDSAMEDKFERNREDRCED